MLLSHPPPKQKKYYPINHTNIIILKVYANNSILFFTFDYAHTSITKRKTVVF